MSLIRSLVPSLLSLVLANHVEGLVNHRLFYANVACTAGRETFEIVTFDGATGSSHLESPALLGPSQLCDKIQQSLGPDYETRECQSTASQSSSTYTSDVETLAGTDRSICGRLSASEWVDGISCSFTSVCSDDEPASLTGEAFNFIAEQYFDGACQHSTGSVEIVPGDAFGVVGGCHTNTHGRDQIVECTDEGRVRSQVYSSRDATCSGTVVYELTSYRNDISGISGCKSVSDNMFTYSPGLCTKAEPTVGPEASLVAPAALTGTGPSPKMTPSRILQGSSAPTTMATMIPTESGTSSEATSVPTPSPSEATPSPSMTPAPTSEASSWSKSAWLVALASCLVTALLVM